MFLQNVSALPMLLASSVHDSWQSLAVTNTANPASTVSRRYLSVFDIMALPPPPAPAAAMAERLDEDDCCCNGAALSDRPLVGDAARSLESPPPGFKLLLSRDDDADVDDDDDDDEEEEGANGRGVSGVVMAWTSSVETSSIASAASTRWLTLQVNKRNNHNNNNRCRRRSGFTTQVVAMTGLLFMAAAVSMRQRARVSALSRNVTRDSIVPGRRGRSGGESGRGRREVSE